MRWPGSPRTSRPFVRSLRNPNPLFARLFYLLHYSADKLRLNIRVSLHWTALLLGSSLFMLTTRWSNHPFRTDKIALSYAAQGGKLAQVFASVPACATCANYSRWKPYGAFCRKAPKDRRMLLCMIASCDSIARAWSGRPAPVSVINAIVQFTQWSFPKNGTRD